MAVAIKVIAAAVNVCHAAGGVVIVFNRQQSYLLGELCMLVAAASEHFLSTHFPALPDISY